MKRKSGRVRKNRLFTEFLDINLPIVNLDDLP